MQLKKFEDLKGQTLTAIEVLKDQPDGDQIIFTLNTGERYAQYHEQDCCEGVNIEDIVGEPQDLLGVPILMAEEATDHGELESGDTYTWTFYKLATIKGYVTIRWYGQSNGYYSEAVNWKSLE